MPSRRLPVLGGSDPAWGFYALGIGGLLFTAGHLVTEGGGVGTVLETVILVTLSAFTAYTGYELPDRELSRQGAADAFQYTCGFAGSFVLLASAIVLIWHVDHGGTREAQFVVVFAGILGTAVGGRASVSAVEFREAYERNQALTKLLTVNQRVLRHNLRNEITIVLGHLEDADETADLKLVRRHLDDLLETSQEARRIAGIWERDVTDGFDLGELLPQCVAAVREEYPDADVAVECPDDVPIVEAHVALPLAIDELLENAIVHNDGDVTVTATCERTPEGVRITVTDTGRGIPVEEANVLFKSVETALDHGNGLGLWLVYWTVQKSDGELSFRERDGGGALVELLLPEA